MDVAQLTTETDGTTGRFELATGQTATLGRSSRCTVRVRDRSVSRVHCQVQLVGGRVVVADLGSTQGVLHRGTVCERLELDVGDGFQIGQTYVQFALLSTEVHAADQPTRPSTPPPPAAAAAGRGPDAPPRASLQPAAAAAAAPGAPVRVVRRPPSRGKALAARLVVELIVFSITGSILLALLLLAKIAFAFDIYRAFGWLPGMPGR
ncbi:MAG: FHA domain-containing protein [Planctomycetes bacterium]|nr:FHA domain-containing protein [Planctomycetota bacterium]